LGYGKGFDDELSAACASAMAGLSQTIRMIGVGRRRMLAPRLRTGAHRWSSPIAWRNRCCGQCVDGGFIWLSQRTLLMLLISLVNFGCLGLDVIVAWRGFVCLKYFVIGHQYDNLSYVDYRTRQCPFTQRSKSWVPL
jgi:hypothetical protein